jgi:hypothetical protein
MVSPPLTAAPVTTAVSAGFSSPYTFDLPSVLLYNNTFWVTLKIPLVETTL